MSNKVLYSFKTNIQTRYDNKRIDASPLQIGMAKIKLLEYGFDLQNIGE